jgi:tetratricopeptide (TPR) repeat protein
MVGEIDGVDDSLDDELSKGQAESGETPREDSDFGKQVEALFALHSKAFPDDPSTWTMIADRDLEAERYQKALGGFQKALERTEDLDEKRDALSQMVDCYIALDQPEKAYKTLSEKQYVFQSLFGALHEQSAEFEMIKTLHHGRFAIDLYVWPHHLDKDFPVSIPDAAAKRLARLAKEVVGDQATVAIHVDSGTPVLCDTVFFDSLASDDAISAFFPAEDAAEDDDA